MLSELLLLSGNDIPFTKAQLTIHQPTMKEIAYIGEESFFVGCEMLNFSKDMLSTEDKNGLSDKSNFQVFMSIMKDKKTSNIQRNRVCALMVISLMFPDFHCAIGSDSLIFFTEYEDEEGKKQQKIEGQITNDNFEDFKEILAQMFCLKPKKDDEQAYNPIGKQAQQIAEKLQKGRQKAAEAKGEKPQKISVFSRYMSILAVGQCATFEELNKYTVYQLFDEFERFELKNEYDVYFRAKLAGAKDLKEVDNWMKDLHP